MLKRIIRKQHALSFHPKLKNIINRNWNKSRLSLTSIQTIPIKQFCSKTEISNIEDEYVNIFKNIINEQEVPSMDNIDEEEEYENLKKLCLTNEVDLEKFFKTPTQFAINPKAYYKIRSNLKKFRDKVVVRVRSGNGGKGCASFYRDNRVSRGPPNGGDGGDGGSIIFKATGGSKPSLNHILPYYKAENGGNGRADRCKGKNGSDLIIEVPLGTCIKEIIKDEKEFTTPENEKKVIEESAEEPDFPNENSYQFEVMLDKYRMEELMQSSSEIKEETDAQPAKKSNYKPFEVDLNNEGEFFVAVRGGAGGLGNWRLANGAYNGPLNTTIPPKPGEEKTLLLELKLIADVGLVGYPNAGKSTFLASSSRATPKIGSYPFTTLRPQIGTVLYDDGSSITISDLPGLIKGAHRNKGLGHDFLRHIERTKILAYIIDMSTNENGDPWEVFCSLRYELDKYKPGLSNRGIILIANKMDQGEEAEKNLSSFMKKLKKSKLDKNILVFPISAQNGVNVEPTLLALKEMVDMKNGKEISSNNVSVNISEIIKPGQELITIDLSKIAE